MRHFYRHVMIDRGPEVGSCVSAKAKHAGRQAGMFRDKAYVSVQFFMVWGGVSWSEPL